VYSKVTPVTVFDVGITFEFYSLAPKLLSDLVRALRPPVCSRLWICGSVLNDVNVFKQGIEDVGVEVLVIKH